MHYDGEALVERIRHICKEKGISIAQMEKELSWSQGLISRWTKNSPSIGKVMEVIQYLEVDYKAILGEIAFTDESPEKEELSERLFRATEMGNLEWDICDKK